MMRKPSVDAEGLFPLEGMDNTSPDTFNSDEDLTDTDGKECFMFYLFYKQILCELSQAC